jgi:DMSO/TMAO reductase YedYZ heme-binding membrane subunit
MTLIAQDARPFRLTAPLALAGIALALCVAAWFVATTPTDALGWQLAARYTARTSFALFLIVYLIAPVATIMPEFASGLKGLRRGLGLAFAGAHFVHLGALVTYFQVSGDTPKLSTLIGGGLAFVLIGLMAITANDAAIRKLGAANWRRLHLFALHYVWLIFVITYAGRVARSPDMPEYVALLALALAALVVRLAARLPGKHAT